MEQEIQYSIGEWIVHSQYRVGQIKKIETMPLHGKQTECFKGQVKGDAFWFPTNSIETSRICPIASQEIITKMIKNLRRKPGNLEKDKKYWNLKIKEMPANSDLLTTSQLIRDLSAQQILKRLNDSQIKALTKFKDRLIHEWAAITGTKLNKSVIYSTNMLKRAKQK